MTCNMGLYHTCMHQPYTIRVQHEWHWLAVGNQDNICIRPMGMSIMQMPTKRDSSDSVEWKLSCLPSQIPARQSGLPTDGEGN